MRLGKAAAALVMFFGLAAVDSAAATGTRTVPARKKHHHLHHVHGVVVSVHYDKAIGHGVIEVKVQHHHHGKKAKNTAAAAVSGKKRHPGVMTFHVNEHTKFEKVIHNQGKVDRRQANFGEVHRGEHVGVTFNARHQAREVDIIVHQHNKKLPPARKPPLKKPR